ncbi:MAG: aspartate carbamoyltransferase, partial [Chlamydiia bacterium]|nr:aspartate carbamoyltransferase [Chlamydiia bacterium]
MKGADLVSIVSLSKHQILQLIERTEEMKKKPAGPILRGHLLASCFFEPSTRTRLSFEAAMKRLGGDVIGFSESTSTSAQKGESLHDTIKIMGLYSDIIAIRHPVVGSAQEAAEATEIPVINAGDGYNEHPTQTLLDLFTMRETQGRLEELKI